MPLKLYAHPFSSYCQKVLVALYENDVPFDYLELGPDHPEAGREFASLWPIGKFPIIDHDGRMVVEATVIIEYLGLHFPSPVRLVPKDPDHAIGVRMLDRIFDNYVMAPMSRIVADAIRPVEDRDAPGVAEAHRQLETSYDWLEGHLQSREWATDAGFSLAECAAAPALFYADWVHPIGEERSALRDYRRRLLERPSFARAVDEARPYRHLFPPGAPDRD